MTTAFDSTGFDATAFDAVGVVYPSGSLSIALSVRIAAPLSVAVPLSVTVVDPAFLSGAATAAAPSAQAAVFGVSVLIGGVEMVDDVVGDIVVEAEENAARIAEFSVCPVAGSAIYLDQWAGRPVAIYFVDRRPGYNQNPVLLFSGRVELPRIDFDRSLISLHCTDSRLSLISGMTHEQIDALVGGFYSANVFNVGAASPTYANDRLSTTLHSLECDPSGRLRLVSILAKETPDFSFNADTVVDGSISVDIAEKSQMVNQVVVDFQYRFPRVKAEGYPVSANWLGLTGFADYVNDQRYIPSRALIVDAIQAAGGSVVSITYDALPTVPVAIGGGFWIPNPYTDGDLCTGFSALVSFDYAQEIEEQHTIVVRNLASIERIGNVRSSMSGALEGKSIDAVNGIETGIQLYKSGAISIPPINVATVVSGETTSANVSLTDDTNRAAADLAMKTLIAIAQKQIIEAHRLNRVSLAVPLNPALDTDKTVHVDLPKIEAQGKCRLVRHRLSPDAGVALTELELAISSIAGVGFVHPNDTLVAPAGVDAVATPLLGDPVVTLNNGLTEDHKLTITFPGVEAVERDKAVHAIPSTFEVAIPEDILRITL